LRVTYSNSFTYEYSQLVKTQSRYLAKQVVVMHGDQKVFSVAIDTIEGIAPDDPALARPADAALVSASIREEDKNKNENGSYVSVGSLVKKTQPDYPLIAKTLRIQGTAVLSAVIGTDGRIHDVETLASPSPLLAKAAEDAVKQWEYKPYLLDGKPVEVETIVNVNFALAR